MPAFKPNHKLSFCHFRKAFSERPNEALFTIDVKPDTDHKPSVMLSSAERKKKALKPAKCFKSLEITTGACDPIVKR